MVFSCGNSDAYNIGSSTIYDLKKHIDKLITFFVNSDSKKQMSSRKTMKEVKSTEHDQVMIGMVLTSSEWRSGLVGSTLIKQVKLFHKELKLENECDYSEGWRQRFKKRYGISMRKVCGEKLSVDHEGATEYVQ